MYFKSQSFKIAVLHPWAKSLKTPVPESLSESCEFCEISKNTFFTEHLRTTASML